MKDFMGLMFKVLTEQAPSGFYNVSTGEGHTIKDIFDVVVAYLGVTLDEPVPVMPPSDDDVQAVVLDPTKTEQDFGWRAETGFKETICNMLEWYDENGVTDIYSHLRKPVSRN